MFGPFQQFVLCVWFRGEFALLTFGPLRFSHPVPSGSHAWLLRFSRLVPCFHTRSPPVLTLGPRFSLPAPAVLTLGSCGSRAWSPVFTPGSRGSYARSPGSYARPHRSPPPPDSHARSRSDPPAFRSRSSRRSARLSRIERRIVQRLSKSCSSMRGCSSLTTRMMSFMAT